MGIKPLYYYFDGLSFAFASEIKALKMLPWFDFEIDKKSLASYETKLRTCTQFYL